MDVIRVARTSAALAAWVDPSERRIYVDDPAADVRSGDTLTVRGLTRRVVDDPDVWALSGLVAVYEEGPPTLPDLGQLLRNGTSAPVLDETTGVLTIPADSSSWTGPCLAEAANTQGNDPELGGQRVGIVPYLITVPLSLVDVKAGDQFKVTQSRDQRLITRLLTITAVRGSSTGLVRELVAFDNQGGV
jgi:hypothetical protein